MNRAGRQRSGGRQTTEGLDDSGLQAAPPAQQGGSTPAAVAAVQAQGRRSGTTVNGDIGRGGIAEGGTAGDSADELELDD